MTRSFATSPFPLLYILVSGTIWELCWTYQGTFMEERIDFQTPSYEKLTKRTLNVRKTFKMPWSLLWWSPLILNNDGKTFICRFVNIIKKPLSKYKLLSSCDIPSQLSLLQYCVYLYMDLSWSCWKIFKACSFVWVWHSETF